MPLQSENPDSLSEPSPELQTTGIDRTGMRVPKPLLPEYREHKARAAGRQTGYREHKARAAGRQTRAPELS